MPIIPFHRMKGMCCLGPALCTSIIGEGRFGRPALIPCQAGVGTGRGSQDPFRSPERVLVPMPDRAARLSLYMYKLLYWPMEAKFGMDVQTRKFLKINSAKEPVFSSSGVCVGLSSVMPQKEETSHFKSTPKAGKR